MQRLRPLLIITCVLALVLGVTASNTVVPPAPSKPTATSSHGPSMWHRLLGHLGIGQQRQDGRPAVAAATGRSAPPMGPRAKPARVKPAGPVRRVRELAGQRTANSQFFTLSDGRVQAEVASAPLFYRDTRGRWQPIDTRVRPVGGQAGFAYGNQTNAFQSLFGTRSDGLVGLDLGGGRVTMGLLGQPRTLVPTVAGDTVTYRDALAGGADLQYQVTREGLKERIVLDGPLADPTFSFGLRLEGVRAQRQPDGSIGFYPADGDGGLLFSMPPPFMTDATEDSSSPFGKRYSDEVAQTVSQQGALVRVTVHADPAWLSSRDRRWPVVIDPTVKIAPTPTQSQDVMLLSDSASTNFEGNGRLSVGTTTTGIARSLIKFDLSTIPANTPITAAQLQLHYDQAHTRNDTSVTIEAHRMTLAWSESTATWTSSSNGVGELGGTAVKPANLGSAWHTFNVKSVVQAWVNRTQTNNGFILKAASETLNQGGPRYEPSELVYNGETDVYPKLLVTYGRPSVTLSPPTTIHATGAELRWTAYQDPSTATGDDLVEYQVHRSVFQNFTPQASTLVAPVPATTLAYNDTSAEPTPADDPDPFGNAYYYMVAVKTKDGQLISSPTELVRLPKAGRVLQILQGNALDTTLSSSQATTGHDTLQNVGNPMPWLEVGNDSSTLGKARAVIKFPSLAPVPTNARVQEALLTLWSTQANNSLASYEAHELTKDFDEATATWQRASTATAWATQGGDFTAAAADTVPQLVTPARHNWDLTALTQKWVSNASTNHGVLLKVANETTPAEHTLFLSSEASEFQLRPQLRITYTEPTPAATYFAPRPPVEIPAGQQESVDVTLTNPTATTWSNTNRALSYHWELPDGTPAPNAAAFELATPLPATVPPLGSVTVHAQVKAPTQTDTTNTRSAYVLKWDLKNTSTGQFLSQTDGIAPLAQNQAVVEPTSDQLGLEKFYQYAGKNTGAGSTAMVNLASGNLVWSYDPFSNPSRGLATFLRMAYNSLDTSDSSMGFGWSLQASSVMRLGSPLDFHPNPNPTRVTLTDGDGTSHLFNFDSATGRWKNPFGVHLFLQRLVVCDPKTEADRAWVMTRPDRTKFYFDCDGYLSSVVDNNSNQLTFTWERRNSNNKPIKFLQYITDPANRQTLTLSYYVKGQTYDYYDTTSNQKITGATNLTNPFIIDHVQTITDISGRQLKLIYSDKGLLKELVDGSGSSLAKTFKFDYDATQGNKNVKLVKVTDPRGNPSTLAYNDPPVDDPKFHWWAKTITDRLVNPTSFAYLDPDGPQGSTIQTSVTDALQHVSTYVMDGFGRPTSATNAKQQTTQLAWDADHNVIRLQENNQAATTWTYDPNTGYPLTMRDAQANADNTPATVLTYNTSLNGHVADLASKTSPEGRKWTFGYDANGNLTSVTDPAGNATPSVPNDFTTTYTYDALGQLQTATDADGHPPTKYASYDANGYPQTITDARNKATQFVYDARGNVTKVTDALLHDTTQNYDLFGRPLDSKVAKDQAANPPVFITTPAPVYDPNDNVTQTTAPNGAVTTFIYDAADEMTSFTAPRDTATDPERKTTYTYDKIGNLTSQTEPNGTLTTSDPNDFVTRYGYNEISQLTSITNAASDKLTYAYDDVGNLVTVIDPKKTASSDPDDFTAKYTYDLAHRTKTVTDAAGHSQSTDYDHDGLVVARTDQDGNKSLITRDARGKPAEVKMPHVVSGGSIVYRTEQFAYDQVGNRTKVITPRGVATPNVTDDFVQQTTYDELNRVKEQLTAFDPNDSRYNTPDKTIYSYDDVGRLTTVSAPPSNGQTDRNDTTYSYFDNGWIKSSTDPWDIVTNYDYNLLGQQTSRIITSAGGSSSRAMSWAYYPDGKLQRRTDDGVPVGKQVVLVDNSDSQNTTAVGTWPTATTPKGFQGIDYRTHSAGTGANTFTWTLNIPQDGTYEVFVKYPAVSGAATSANYAVTHSAGTTSKTVNQTQQATQWVSLGSFAFTQGNMSKVVLSDNAAGGTVLADAVKLVRDNLADTDNEKKTFVYGYDPNGNLRDIGDQSPGAKIDDYAITYTGLDQIAKVEEKKTGSVLHTTTYTYDPNGNPGRRGHDGETATYTYDARDLLTQISDAQSPNDPNPKVTTFGYDAKGHRAHEVKGNGNTVDYAYFLDGLLQHQIEKKPNGTLVSEHTLDYDANGNKASDVERVMNADNHAALITRTTNYTYDPRDRLASLTKTDGGGSTVATESYVHDANSNVVSQTVKGTTTTYTYDRNRLLSALANGVTASYNYDPFGRLDTITAAGQIIEKLTYDGFDRTTELRKITDTGSTTTTRYTYDPLDRTSSRTTDVGTASEKTTDYNYLGLTANLIDENIAGELTKSYQYSPWGERLSQVKFNTDGSSEGTYYGYNPHSDVETLTDQNGDTKATYGYTAFGQADATDTTGVDKPDVQDPTKEPYNPYRFNSMRWDATSGDYDMGFRDYDPGLNRFLTRDLYGGALADQDLTTDPFTGNRYAFAGGNPVSNVEIDGHRPIGCDGECLMMWSVAQSRRAAASSSSDGPTLVERNGGVSNIPVACANLNELSAHDAAVCHTAMYAQLWAKQHNIEGYVTVDVGPGGQTANKIPGASGGKDPEEAGAADVIFWGKESVWVWEVKPGSKDYGKTQGPADLRRYREKLQEYLEAEGDPRDVRNGVYMIGGYVPSREGWQRTWSERDFPGMRFYGAHEGDPPRDPVLIYDRQEQPDKSSRWQWRMPDLNVSVPPLSPEAAAAAGGAGALLIGLLIVLAFA